MSDEPRSMPLSTPAGGKPHPDLDGDPQTSGEKAPDRNPQAVDNLGKSVDPVGTQVGTPAGTTRDIAASALADAQRISRTTPRRRGGSAARRENLAGRNKGGYSGPAPDPARDPHRLGDVLAGYVEERGWDRPISEARVFAEWAGLVGAEVAAHCEPSTLREGVLAVAAESTAWATQLRLLSATLLARLVAELGPDVVTRLQITGPTGPSWKHGGYSVRGARGPRDTYG